MNEGDPPVEVQIEKLENAIKDIQSTVHKLDSQKQDKVKPSVIITVVLYLLSQLLIGVWWASHTTSQIEKILERIEITGKDRFYGRDGVALRSYIDLNLAVVKTTTDALIKKTDSQQIRLIQCQSNLNNILVEVSTIKEQIHSLQIRNNDDL